VPTTRPRRRRAAARRRGVTIICHGSSPPKAIRNAIRVAHQAMAVHLSTHIGEELAGEGAAR
jgi:fatty acid/phospholipid biosynthesis enzyme